MKRSTTFILALALLLLCGCGSARTEAGKPGELRFLFYTADENGDIAACPLTVDLSNGTLVPAEDVLFRLSDANGQFYPVMLCSDRLVLCKMPEYSALPTEAAAERTLYFQDYTLSYDGALCRIERGGALYAEPEPNNGDCILTPEAFFIDENGTAVVLCHSEELLFDDAYTTALLCTPDGAQEDYRFTALYDSGELSKLRFPTGTGVSASAALRAFLWLEGENIVRLDPYTGKFSVLFRLSDIRETMPFMDLYREDYAFFTGLGYQDGAYALLFPNYNRTAGTVAALFDADGDYLGYLLCDTQEIRLFDADRNEIASADTVSLGLLYAETE